MQWILSKSSRCDNPRTGLVTHSVAKLLTTPSASPITYHRPWARGLAQILWPSLGRGYTPSIRQIILSLVVSIGILWPIPAHSVAPGAGEGLLKTYRKIGIKLINSDFCIPLYLESRDANNSLRGDIYGTLAYPLEHLRQVLCKPVAWCDIASLHLNIKACTWKRLSDSWLLTFYSGRKFYQPPEDTYQLEFAYRIIEQQSDYLKISLTAGRGPLNTRDYRIVLEGVCLDADNTFLHFSYTYRYGSLARLAMKGYFATLGHGKYGFTVVNTDSRGNPVYVKDARGAIERNAVRYYFAIQAYMDSLICPKEKRFEKRVSIWYDLTDQHHQQLFEMSKEDYLAYKRQERKNQVALQRKLGHHHASGIVP